LGVRWTTVVEVIQALLPLVVRLAGERRPGHVRWGRQGGSVYLADQKLPIRVPRVRNRITGKELPLETYARLQRPRRADMGLLGRVLKGLSCRDYEECAEAVPEAFGRASASKLRELWERRLEGLELVALVLDGKTFAEDTIVIALGITLGGQKVLLGFVQTGTENERVFGAHALMQRCQWHKRENVVNYLPKGKQAWIRRKLQAAYGQPTHEGARAALGRVRQELALMNHSAVRSLEEGLEETLTLHRLGVFPALGASLKTTNCLESLMALVGQRTDKVDRWRNSDQKQR